MGRQPHYWWRDAVCVCIDAYTLSELVDRVNDHGVIQTHLLKQTHFLN